MKDGSIINGKLTANSTNDSLWVKILSSGRVGGSTLAIKPNEVVKTTYFPQRDISYLLIVLGGGVIYGVGMFMAEESYDDYYGVRVYRDKSDAEERRAIIGLFSGVVTLFTGVVMYFNEKEFVNPSNQTESSNEVINVEGDFPFQETKVLFILSSQKRPVRQNTTIPQSKRRQKS